MAAISVPIPITDTSLVKEASVFCDKFASDSEDVRCGKRMTIVTAAMQTETPNIVRLIEVKLCDRCDSECPPDACDCRGGSGSCEGDCE